MMQAKSKLGNPVLWALVGLLAVASLLIGLTTSASAGSAGNQGKSPTPHKKCHKKKSNGSAKSSGKRKCKKKPKQGSKTPAPPVVTPPVVTPPVVPPPAVTTLAINPASFDYGTVAHGGKSGSTQAFTVTNSGGATSGVPTASIVELHNSESEKHAAFQITVNTCTAALAPGASCSLSVKFAPVSNAGDQMFSSRLDVTASPGSTASSVLSGIAG
jgi:hypothetical protein